jgi:nucleosome binding factor SPN SPT16 subunit
MVHHWRGAVWCAAGTLEAHKNGFLYTSRRGERIKILYNNVKYAFFQPPDNDIVIMLHFHLHNGLMIGKKQHKDIQFYVEVGEVSTDLGKRMGAHERDEVEAEHRERVMRSKTKKLFKSFMEKVTHLTHTHTHTHTHPHTHTHTHTHT